MDSKSDLGTLRARTNNTKPVALHNNSKPIGLCLNDGDSLKTPTLLGNSEVTLRTPTILGSPTKGPLSAATHSDDLITPKLNLSTYPTPNTQAQAFFGDHEPLLTANIEISTVLPQSSSIPSSLPATNVSSSNNSFNDNKDQKATITIKGSISTSISTFGTQSVNSPGLSATMFQFSPLVEHFLQSITKTQQTNSSLPLLVLDSNAKTPSATDTPDLFKVLQDRKDGSHVLSSHPQTSQATNLNTTLCPQLSSSQAGSSSGRSPQGLTPPVCSTAYGSTATCSTTQFTNDHSGRALTTAHALRVIGGVPQPTTHHKYHIQQNITCTVSPSENINSTQSRHPVVSISGRTPTTTQRTTEYPACSFSTPTGTTPCQCAQGGGVQSGPVVTSTQSQFRLGFIDCY
ncbi:hypothetical protein AB6A40_005140 [Gnathostoma spinigerum]|uniref:Uncharacterized protein n=1 Tax=Gnathostoma spinigerum TaxID=75299 RepID=A0ABD6ELX7_9BILA